jgi:hypothetical protein
MERHIADVIDALLRGRVVPFLGAGVNLCNRPVGNNFTWSATSDWLPNGAELATHLAERFRYPIPQDCRSADCPLRDQCQLDDCPRQTPGPAAECLLRQADLDLARVAQYGATRLGPGALYQELNDLFDGGYSVTDVHRFLASLAFQAPGARQPWARHLLIVSTNYDDLMERAFGDQAIDLVYYDPENPDPGGSPRGRFVHQRPGGVAEAIERPNEYDYPFLEERPTVLKIHGTKGHPVVITEDHYIDYLADEAFTKLPKRLLTRLCNSHLLFLGYSLRDWNFRVFLRRIKRNRTQDFTSWAVVRNTDDEEQSFWRERARVEIQQRDLGEYVSCLGAELGVRNVRSAGLG